MKADALTDKPLISITILFNRSVFVDLLRRAGFVIVEMNIYGQRLQLRIEEKGFLKFYR